MVRLSVLFTSRHDATSLRMLVSPTYLRQSAIRGTRVFMWVDISAGTTVWESTADLDWRIPVSDFERFPQPYRAYLRA